MICLKCGAGNPEDAHFCQNCGASLQSMESVPPVSAPSHIPDAGEPIFLPSQTSPKNPRKKRLYLWLIIGFILLAACITAGLFGFHAYQGHRYQEQLSLGEKYIKELNYEDAVVALNAAIEIDPKKPEPYVLLADVYIAQEKYEEAENILQQGYEATGGAESIRKKQDEMAGNPIYHSPNLKADDVKWIVEPSWEYDAVLPISGPAFSDIEGYFADGDPLFPEETFPFCEISFSSYSNLPEYYAVQSDGKWHIFHMPSQTDTALLENEGKAFVYYPHRYDSAGIDIGAGENTLYVPVFSLESPWDVLFTSARGGSSGGLFWDISSETSYFYCNGVFGEPPRLKAMKALKLHKPYPVQQMDLSAMGEQTEDEFTWTAPEEPNILEGSYAYVSKTGELLTEFEYACAQDFSDGLAACSKDEKSWGYIDEEGRAITESVYEALWDTDGDGIADSAYPCTDDTIVVLKEGEYGLLYRDGSILIAFGEFEALSPSWNNQLWAKQDGKWGLIDLSDAKKQAGLEVAEQDEPPQESEEKEETIDSVEYSIERDDRSIRDAEGNSIFDVYFDTVVIEGNSSVCNTINQQIEKVKDSFFTDIDSTVKSQTEMAKESYDRFGAFQCSAEPEIMTNGGGILSIRWLTYSYFGGVGVGGAIITNFDPKTGELLELEDLYSITGTELREYLQQQCVEYVNQHPEIAWSDFGEYAAEYVIDHASLEQYPFYIQNGMAYIQFDQYELAAGAAGNISIPCPII